MENSKQMQQQPPRRPDSPRSPRRAVAAQAPEPTTPLNRGVPDHVNDGEVPATPRVGRALSFRKAHVIDMAAIDENEQ